MASLRSRIVWLFVFQGEVTRRQYLFAGFALMLSKYLVEASVIGYITDRFYSPLDFINPLLSARSQFTVGAPEWLGFAWILWTLPFVWIAVAMSMRRCVNAGMSTWCAMVMFVPVANLLGMLYLAYVSGEHESEHYSPRTANRTTPYQSAAGAGADSLRRHSRILAPQSALVGIGVGTCYMFGVTLLSIYSFGSYGAALFFGSPIVAGATTAYLYNRSSPQPVGRTLGLAAISGFIFALGYLLIGLEGLICIAMATPIMLPLAILGALIGRAIAVERHTRLERKDRGLLGCLLALPLLAGFESQVTTTPEFEVRTSVEIAASPAEVWDLVVGFPPITSPEPWYFRTGIASPREATIDGTGVGAIRYCKFTTGEFVEPITVWDEPRRLAFDVTDQPEPMTELSPYRHIHPPHLEGSFRSTRGEFRLIDLGNGNTRLEGSTWYTVAMRPLDYWTLWTDAIIHRIHLRVLDHIKQSAEAASPE